MSGKRRYLTLTVAAAAVLSACTIGAMNTPQAAEQSSEMSSADMPVGGLRRLTGSQYQHTIKDAFGSAVQVSGRFEPEQRMDGLLAVGSSELSISSAGFAQYFESARSISGQVLSEELRVSTVPCAPATATESDAVCAEAFFRKHGAYLFRRPLTDPEVEALVDLANTGAVQNNDFYKGLELGLISLLSAPDFLFRFETTEPDPDRSGQKRLDGYSIASRISFLLWDTSPDDELRRAAAAGELATPEGRKRQIDRMLADKARLNVGMRAFFEDMLMFDKFDTLSKVSTIYPEFSTEVASSAREQTLLFLTDLLIDQEADYRKIFTSQDTWMNRALAGVHDVPFQFEGEWERYTYPEDSNQSGVLTQTSYLSLFSHPGVSSPTLRGVGIREIFMCQPIPLPPPDVDFSLVQDNTSKTVRDRLLEHAGNAGCATCHNVMDPPGLALEHFDAIGLPQLFENDIRINVASELDGVELEGSRGLGRALAANSRVTECLTEKVYSYGVGRATGPDDEHYLKTQTEEFAQSGYRVPQLLASIAASPEFLSFGKAAPHGAAAFVMGVASAEDIASGRAAFTRTCAGCHGPTGAGIAGVGPTLVGVTDAENITKQIREGGGRMPPMGALLSSEEVANIVHFVTGGMPTN